ncbi:hypothetical protein Ciccas_001750 [Cichlidogyrus casuarinus]|uniref:Uncharacterized protein n=1 Tax=Cichlidogyrus casuarinus TaxID=1844966 RepID=A0ABD2QJ56_9PLAT
MKTSYSWTTIRKTFAALGFGLKGIFFVAMGFATRDFDATCYLSLSLGFSGLAVSGYAVNVIDLSPNFSGLVMGFANTISTFTGKSFESQAFVQVVIIFKCMPRRETT